MREMKLTDEAVNATVKSLKWVCNQIPNDLGNSNEEKMLKCIQLYCEQGIAVIHRLQNEASQWKSKAEHIEEVYNADREHFIKTTTEQKAEIERLTEEKAELKAQLSIKQFKINALKAGANIVIGVNEVLTEAKKTEIRKQAVKDTAKEILGFILAKEFEKGDYLTDDELKKAITERYGVEIKE